MSRLLLFSLVLFLACEDKDEKIDLPDSKCYIEPDVGPCDGVCPRYFYNQETEQCEEFSWGCCEGLVPFDTLEECINTCE